MKSAQNRLLGFLFALFLVLKLITNPRLEDTGVDGAYYLDVAQHVRDGHGLMADSSLYHAGFTEFPWHTPVQPLWPLVLGLSARLLGMDLAMSWVPTFFYFAALYVGYRLVTRLLPGPILPGIWNVPTAGHLFVLVLGTNSVFFEHTTKPYTEGLGFFLLFMCFTSWEHYFRSPTARGALATGATTGLLLMVRSQFIVQIGACIAIGGLYWLWGLFRRDRSILTTGILLIPAFLFPMIPQWLHLRTFIENPGLGDMLWFEKYKVTPELSTMQLLVPTDGPLDYLRDRAQGFVVAFDIASKYSYHNVFGPLYWTIVPAISLLFVWFWKLADDPERQTRYRSAEWLKGKGFFLLLLSFSALLWFASLHALHKESFSEWNFGLRHALPCFLLFFPALLFLLRQQGTWHFVAILLLGGSTYESLRETLETPNTIRYEKDERAMFKASRQFLDDHADEMICSPQAQRFGAFRDGLKLHGLYENTPIEDIEILHRLGCKWILIPAIYDKEYVFLSAEQFPSLYQPVPDALPKWNVYQALP